MSRKHIVPTLGAILVVVLPIVGHTVYGQRPVVHLVLECTAAALGVLGFTVTKPLFGGTGSTPS
jgi:hypothetical protein